PAQLLSFPTRRSSDLGRGPGLLAVALAAIGSGFLFLAPGGFGADDLLAVAALIAENILIVEITVRLRAAQERAGAEAAEAQKARTEASFALQMREELLTFWSQRLRGPFGDLGSRLARLRHAVESNDRAGTISALDDLAKDITAVQRTAEHWIEQRQKTS